MGVDYYRCTNCDLQVCDADPYYDTCNGCSSIICWNCTFDLGIRAQSPDYESPGEPVVGPFKMKKVIESKSFPEDYYWELMNCPMCIEDDKEKQKEAVLKYLLKKNKLTLKKAIKEMNRG